LEFNLELFNSILIQIIHQLLAHLKLMQMSNTQEIFVN
jgi:hypothetical protein